jgi:osmotically-inducible protein OsmY
MKTLTAREWPKRAAIGRWSAILLLAVGIQPWVWPRLQAAAANKEITDRALTSAVSSGLHFDRPLQPYSLGVRASEGFVTLSGPVDNLFARRRAVKIAESVRGVRGVIDHISVTPRRGHSQGHPDGAPARSRHGILSGRGDRRRWGANLDRAGWSVGGSATGPVPRRKRQGVRDIRNDLRINYINRRTDAEMTADVQATLNWDIWVHDCPVRAEVKDGQAILSGRVGNAIQKFRSNMDAWVRGVQSVQDSGLKVDPAALDQLQRRTKAAALPDAAIRDAVTAALRQDPRASRYPINVIVEDGVVILEGAVGYLKAKTTAEQDARDTLGVESVDNELTVRPEISTCRTMPTPRRPSRRRSNGSLPSTASGSRRRWSIMSLIWAGP